MRLPRGTEPGKEEGPHPGAASGERSVWRGQMWRAKKMLLPCGFLSASVKMDVSVSALLI